MPINKKEWLERLLYWKQKWTQFPPECDNDENGISLYKFTQILQENLRNDDVLVGDAGSVGYVLSQSLELKGEQRYLLDSGQMSMGSAIGMSCGACLARDNKDVICIVGDGSFFTGMRELSPIIYNKLRVKIFVWDNNGYLSIRNTSKSFYDGRLFGTDMEHGVHFPELCEVAKCYDLKYLYCNKIKYLSETIELALEYDGPYLVEIKCDPNQKITPNLAMKNGKACTLDDMTPFLSDAEREIEMIKD